MSRVTVLMSVLNGEKYLRQAVDSVLNQTHRDIRLVCIDDASTDSTPQILAEYAAADSRVTVLTHLQNTGQAVARNDGLKYAEGEYVTMVDADDWLSADAIASAVAVLDSDSSVGAVLFDLHYVRDGVETPYDMRTATRRWTGPEAMKLSLDWSVHGLYVARAGLYEKYPFDTACKLYSDDNTTRMHFLHSTAVACCEGIYYYRMHGESMTNADSIRRYDLLEANSSMARQLRQEGLPDDIRAVFEKSRWINLTGIAICWTEHRWITDDKENSDVLRRLKAVYGDIEFGLLPLSLKMKFGYRPCRDFEHYMKAVSRYALARRLLGRN